MTRIYLDNAATTALRSEALDAMVPLLAGASNPSSLHAEGRAARAALDRARAAVAAVLRCSAREVVFTGGGSEAVALAIAGAARAAAARGRHLVTSAAEHHAVLRAADQLEGEGWDVTRLPVDEGGLVDRAAFAAALTARTTLASIMLANNELGTIAPVALLAGVARAAGVLFHTDAVQAAGALDLDVGTLGVDLLSLSGHKFGGPKGVGVLYVRAGTPVAPLIAGGGQENGLRAGTENLAGIAGLAAALTAAAAERAATAARLAALRDRLEAGIEAAIPDVRVNGREAPRLPGILSVAFGGVPADALLMRLDLEGVAASAGSACAAGSLEASHVAAAIGLPDAYRRGTIRFSLGRATTSEEIERVVRLLPALVANVRTPAQVR